MFLLCVQAALGDSGGLDVLAARYGHDAKALDQVRGMAGLRSTAQLRHNRSHRTATALHCSLKHSYSLRQQGQSQLLRSIDSTLLSSQVALHCWGYCF